jgi:hypothetical protein
MSSLIYVTDWERASLWRRVPCAFLRVSILLVLLAVLITILGPPVTIFVTARWEAKKIPGVMVTPKALSDYSVPDAPGTVLSYFGYEFQVPWGGRFKEKAINDTQHFTRNGPGTKSGLVQLKFDSGQDLLFIAPENQEGLLTEMVQDESMHMKNMQDVFGDLTNHSAYDQYAALLNTTASTIRAFGPRAEATRGMALLTIKAIAFGPGIETGVYSFELRDKRGFQIGDPRKSSRADLEIFGMGGHHVEFICTNPKDGARFSQPELNLILTTLRPSPPESSVTPSSQLSTLPNNR